jgi:hypothetical protein
MELKRDEFEIRDNPCDGFAEGKTNDPVKEEDIRKHLLEKCGYKTKDISIWWDDMMKLWQWNCDISPA